MTNDRTIRLAHARLYRYNQLVKTLSVVGDSAVVATHATSPFTLSGTDQYNQPLAPPTGTFQSGTPATATIDPSTGVANGIAAGTTIITAVNGAVTSAPPITLVVQAQVAGAIIAAPSTFTIAPGATQQLSAVVGDQVTADRHTIVGAVVAWSTSNGNIATVNSSGLVTGVAGGTVIITATSGAVITTCTGTITSPVTTPNAPASVVAGTIGWDEPLQKATIPIIITKPTTGSTPDHYRVVVNGTTQAPDVAYGGTTTVYTVAQPAVATDTALTVDVYSVIGGTTSVAATTITPTQIADGWYGVVGLPAGVTPITNNSIARADDFSSYTGPINSTTGNPLKADPRYATASSNAIKNNANYGELSFSAVTPLNITTNTRSVQCLANNTFSGNTRISETLGSPELSGDYYFENLFRFQSDVNAGNGFVASNTSTQYNLFRVILSTTGPGGSTTTSAETTYAEIVLYGNGYLSVQGRITSAGGSVSSIIGVALNNKLGSDIGTTNGSSSYASIGSMLVDARWYRLVPRVKTIAGGFQIDIYIGLLGHPLMYCGGYTFTNAQVTSTAVGRVRWGQGMPGGFTQLQWLQDWSVIDASAYPSAWGALPAPQGVIQATGYNYTPFRSVVPMGIYSIRAGYEINSDPDLRALMVQGTDLTPSGDANIAAPGNYIYQNPALKGTAPAGSSKLRDLVNVDLLNYDPAVLINGLPSLSSEAKGGTCASNSQAKTSTSFIYFPANRQITLLWVRRYFVVTNMPTGTVGNSACSFNASQNAAYKWGPNPGFSNYSGRGDTEWANGFYNSGTGIAGANWTVSIGAANATGSNVCTQTGGNPSGTAFTSYFTDNVVYQQVVLLGFYHTSPTPLYVHRLWVAPAGNPLVINGSVTASLKPQYSNVPKFDRCSFGGQNHNQSMRPESDPSPQYFKYNFSGIEAADGFEIQNPFGVPGADLSDLLPFG